MNRSLMPEEYPITLYLNGTELATYQLTKADLEDWAVGYLYSEGIIDSINDLVNLVVDGRNHRILAEIDGKFDAESFTQKRKHFTAGCGRGITFFSMADVKKFTKSKTDRVTTLSYLLKKRHEFAQSSPMYLDSGGMHGACIVERDGTITVREDIGRHNAVDKAIGFALRTALHAEDLILLTTGRISYEMLAKAARYGIGIIGSRTAATKQAIQLARFLNIEIAGYLRGKRAVLYTSEGRIMNDLSEIHVVGASN